MRVRNTCVQIMSCVPRLQAFFCNKSKTKNQKIYIKMVDAGVKEALAAVLGLV